MINLNSPVLILRHVDQEYYLKIIKVISKIFKHCNSVNYSKLYINKGRNKFEDYLLDYIREKKIKILIIFTHDNNFELNFNFLKKIRENNVKILFWFKDDFTNFENHSRFYAFHADGVITNYMSAFHFYENIHVNAVYAFDAFDKKTFKPKKLKKKYDVSFIGSLDKGINSFSRSYFLKKISKNKKIKLKIIDTIRKRIPIEELIKIYSQTKINLNFTSSGSRFEKAKKINPFGLLTTCPKGRLIEIGLTNSFVLTEYASELKYSFNLKKELPVFYNEYDLLKKIEFYLSNPKKRNLISNNLYKKCISKYEIHSWTKNILLEMIYKINNSKVTRKDYQIYVPNYFLIKRIKFIIIYYLKRIRFIIKK